MEQITDLKKASERNLANGCLRDCVTTAESIRGKNTHTDYSHTLTFNMYSIISIMIGHYNCCLVFSAHADALLSSCFWRLF